MRLTLLILLIIAGSPLFANFSQAHWRWRKDNGSEIKATALSPQDFPFTLPFVAGVTDRLRLEVYNSLGNNEAGVVTLQYQRGSSGAWTTISDTLAGHDFVMAGHSPYVTDGQPTTVNLIRDDGAGTFAGGRFLVSTWQFSDTVDAGMRKEYEWCVTPTASVNPDSVYQFQLVFTGSQDAMNYGSPLPDMMYLPDVSIPGNTGIYRDSLVTGFYNRDSGWIASDGNMSIPLSDGRDLWAMNDSYINNFDTLAGTTGCLFQVRNSALVQPLNNWNPAATTTLIGHSSSTPSLFKNDSNNNFLLWPTGGYQYGDTVYVYNMNIENSSGGLGFTSGGNDFLGKMSMPGLQVVGFDSLQNFGGAVFGLGFDTKEPGNYIYTWGYKSGFIASNIVVARFPKNNPAAPWSFWNGTAWDTATANMATIGNGASNGVYVAKVKNKYVLVSTEFSIGCDGGTHIYVATSDSITGPFTANKALYTITDNDLGHTPFFYGPSIHPEYINSKNEILISYDINCYTNCEPSCINNGFNPDYYRPRGLRVPLALIDSSLVNCDTTQARSADGKNGWRVLAYPNPAHGCFTLALQGCTERKVDVRLLSLLGTSVYHEQLPVNDGTCTKMISVPGVSKGVYFLVVQGSTSTQFDKILLQ
jgi:Secretion system C-terminal sorting domain